MSKSIQREEFLFHTARALPTPEARLEYLDHECAGDNELKNRVLALIQLSESADAFFSLESLGQPRANHPNDRRLQ